MLSVEDFIDKTSILYESSKMLKYKLKISSRAAKIFTDMRKNEIKAVNKNEICKDLKVEFSSPFHINIKVMILDNNTGSFIIFDFIGNYFIQCLEKIREKTFKRKL